MFSASLLLPHALRLLAVRIGTTPKTPYINNHLRFIIKFHKDEKFEGARIVGFEVRILLPTSPTPDQAHNPSPYRNRNRNS